VLYDKFLKEGKERHLKDAKKILKENRNEMPFE
jgi:hypothetical protein